MNTNTEVAGHYPPVEWNTSQKIYPKQDCIHRLFEAEADRNPDAIAVTFKDEHLTYGELNCKANQLAHYLQQQGVGPDVLVGLCVERSLEMVIGLLGILKAGGAYVPLDPTYPSERIAFLLNDAQVPVLVTQQGLLTRLPTHSAKVICMDTDTEVLVQQSQANVRSATTIDHLAYIIYTSGSTGYPKGVQITHDNLLNLIYWHQDAFTVTDADRATQIASPAFDATGWELWPYLTIGASVYLIDEDTRTDPARLINWLVERRITISFLPTTLAERVITQKWPTTTSLRFLLTGADALHLYPPPDLPFAFINNYGPTEATVVTTSGQIWSTSSFDGPPSIGRPIANTQVYILDEHLQQLPIGTVGELYIGGAGLAKGYLNNPQLTAERFIPHPFSTEPGVNLYKTGDLVRYLPDGQIAFVGRIDQQVKIRGYRIETNEIVTVLNQHPAIHMSIVVAHEEAIGDKRLVAYIIPEPGEQMSATTVREMLATHLPDYMIPATIVVLETFPQTPNGKIDRDALPTPDETNTLHDEIVALPETPLEKRLAEIVASLLNLKQVGLDDNFFLLGGHSLLGTQLIMHVAKLIGVELTLRTLFNAPTIRTLAAEIEARIIAKVNALSDEEVRQLLA